MVLKVKSLVPGLVSLFYLTIVLALIGELSCKPSEPVMDATAAAIYAAELQACVANSKTLKESKDCRDAVDRKWGVK